VGGNEKEIGRVENIVFLPPSICFFVLFEREIKRRCVCGSGDGKELEKCREFFVFW